MTEARAVPDAAGPGDRAAASDTSPAAHAAQLALLRAAGPALGLALQRRAGRARSQVSHPAET